MPRHLAARQARRGLPQFLSRSDGASAVEFAIVAPIFILILVGIIVYGIYFGTALTVTQVAAEAARASVAGLSAGERAALAQARASEIVSAFGFLSPERMTVTAVPRSGNPDIFDVSVSYDASDLPIFAFQELVPLPPSLIVRVSSIQRGGF